MSETDIKIAGGGRFPSRAGSMLAGILGIVLTYALTRGGDHVDTLNTLGSRMCVAESRLDFMDKAMLAAKSDSDKAMLTAKSDSDLQIMEFRNDVNRQFSDIKVALGDLKDDVRGLRK